MVRLVPLLVGFGLAAGKSIEVSSGTSLSGNRTSKMLDISQSVKQAKTLPFLTNILPSLSPPAKKRQGEVRFPQQLVDHSQHRKHHQKYEELEERPSASGVNRDTSGFHHSGGSYQQPSDSYTGYSSYQPSGYDDQGSNHAYSESSYSSVDGKGGGFLQNIGKYGIILIPILLVIGALFLFPSVINVGNSGRKRRDIEDPTRPADSDDLVYRLKQVYDSISREPLCVSRLYCELGAGIGKTPYANYALQLVEMFYPSEESQNVQVMRKAAVSEEPKCHLLQCTAWEDQPVET